MDSDCQNKWKNEITDERSSLNLQLLLWLFLFHFEWQSPSRHVHTFNLTFTMFNYLKNNDLHLYYTPHKLMSIVIQKWHMACRSYTRMLSKIKATCCAGAGSDYCTWFKFKSRWWCGARRTVTPLVFKFCSLHIHKRTGREAGVSVLGKSNLIGHCGLFLLSVWSELSGFHLWWNHKRTVNERYQTLEADFHQQSTSFKVRNPHEAENTREQSSFEQYPDSVIHISRHSCAGYTRCLFSEHWVELPRAVVPFLYTNRSVSVLFQLQGFMSWTCGFVWSFMCNSSLSSFCFLFSLLLPVNVHCCNDLKSVSR